MNLRKPSSSSCYLNTECFCVRDTRFNVSASSQVYSDTRGAVGAQSTEVNNDKLVFRKLSRKGCNGTRAGYSNLLAY